MTIETNFNIYDKVWYIHDREIILGTIFKVYTSHYVRDEFGNITDDVSYDVCGVRNTDNERIKEHHLFRTKEELIENLLK